MIQILAFAVELEENKVMQRPKYPGGRWGNKPSVSKEVAVRAVYL